MIIKGASRRSISFWARHLVDETTNDRVELVERRGLAPDSLRGMMREMRLDATLTGASNFMYIASFNPHPDARVTEHQWERMLEIFEHHRGIPAGQPRFVVEHHKSGRIHRHAVWSRIDMERLKAFPDALNFRVCQSAQRQIERELGMQPTHHPPPGDSGLGPPTGGPKSWEMFRGQRTDIDPRRVTADVTAAYRASVTAAEFIERLRALGFEPCHGDRRAYCILDPAGDVHSLARRIDGISTKQLRAFFETIDPKNLPTLDDARARVRERLALLASNTQSLSIKEPSPYAQSAANDQRLDATEENWTLGTGPVPESLSVVARRPAEHENASSADENPLLQPRAETAEATGAAKPEEAPSPIAPHATEAVTEAAQQQQAGQSLSLARQFKTLVAMLLWSPKSATTSFGVRVRRSGSGDRGFMPTARSLLRRLTHHAEIGLDSVYWCYFSNSPDPTVLNFIHGSSESAFAGTHSPQP